ncbi:MAG: BREX system P-loop protein BrxC, partial [Propionibacteriaceae bacterium]|nr:BREX system P-loop protein BrxC [Propionibacteriaceae bacterium]
MTVLPIGGIFTKDIARPIEGVIKADDAEHLAIEIEEYVLTNETASALSDLLETYTAPVYGGGNGVWISGFFGSGKSHLLKMLAHLLGDVPDQSYPREEVIAQFKAKASADAMLAASITKTASTPATSLLFNIDVKAPLIDKSQRDALLQVFVKVFNEARGYYSGAPSVARFERDLDRRGLLDQFKTTFQAVAGVPWEQGREEGILQEHNVTQAWSKVTDEPTTEMILSRYEDQFHLSIEDFADEVAEWLTAKAPEHRLLFMVDEVGQFIGQDTHLMLNLQSIVEQLNTKCKGRAWVCVTSQEDMEGVIGDQTKWQANDFSKIQARFVTRMKLTSRDVEEVIEKRLLGKNPAGRDALALLYDEQGANFRTLFEFVDGAKTYRNYQSPEHFIGIYPFVPYQFPFFQAALRGLSEHNVFEGRHASVGERSMLGVVQDVTKKLVAAPVGQLVPFDLMFAGISRSVKSTATHNISVAEQNLPAGEEREIAVRLLKALFLVKHIKGFNATPRNLTVLLYDEFDSDLGALTAKVVAALDLLERQTYVQRNGTSYEYLTNEEQEIEQEIKNTDIDSVEVSKLLAKIISEDVTRTNSVRHQATGRDFKYEIRLDDASYSRAQPLAVHYISPALGQPREVVLAQSMGRNEVRVILANDPKLYFDLRLQVQTDKYIRQKTGSGLSDTQRHIIDSKALLNQERRRELISRVKDAISKSELVINGATIT